jgi:hypothetical protein
MAGAFRYDGPSPMGLAAFVQQQGQMGKQQGEDSRLARLVSGAMANPSQRQSALTEMASIRPEAAFQAQGQFDQQDDRKYAELGKRAAVLAGAPEAMRGQVWAQLRPELEQTFGMQGLPAEVTPEILQTAQQLAQVYGGMGQAGGVSVRSSFVGEDGQMYSIMSDGSVKPQGVGADRKLQAFDVPGVGPQVVDLRNATARGVTRDGMSAPSAAPASQFAFTPAPGAENDPAAADFQNLPPDQQQAAAQLLQRGQDFTIQGGRVVPAAMRGGQPMGQPAPTLDRVPLSQLGGGDGSPAWVRPASGARGDAGAVAQLSPQEVAQLGLPEGTVAQRGPDGKVTTIFTPDAGSRKAAREASTKLPRVDAAMRRVDRLSEAIETIAGGFFDGGPIDQAALKFTPDGQEVIQAAASLLPELTALTRVPGVGSQSDLETRLANLQLPSLEFPPEVNRRALAELRTFMQDLAEVYRGMAQGTGTQPQQPAPQADNDEEALIGKYL